VNTVIARLNPAYPAVAAAAAAKPKDCDENKAVTAFTTPPCGDAAAPVPAGAAVAQPGAGSAPVAKPPAAGGAPRPDAAETTPAGGRH
jgi:hypothetical protein